MTEIRIAETDADYELVASRSGVEPEDLMFPTLIAYRGEDFVGSLGTRNRDDMVIAGPLYIAENIPHKGHLASRLIDAYDRVMVRLGIVSYFFHVAAQNQAMMRSVERLQFARVDDDDEGIWYRRELQ